MIKKILISLLMFVLIMISNPVKAKLQINISENTVLKPGQLTIIKVNISNSSDINQTINPDLVLPKDWKLVIPLKSVSIGPHEKKSMNILLQPPKQISSAIYHISLEINTQKKNYRIQIPIKIKEIYETEVKVVEAPSFIEKEFEIKLKVINKGNTSRHFKILNTNALTFDKTNIFFDSYESKIITFKCRIKEYERKELVLNIRVEDDQKKIISLFNKNVSILEPDKRFNKYKSHLNFRLVKEGEEYKQYWRLKTLLNKNSFLEIGNNHFNYYQKNKKSRWQFGSEYLDRINLKESSRQSNNVKISYEFGQNNESKRIVYTNFVNEIGVGFLKYFKDNLYYLEFKNNKVGRIDYYFNTSIRKGNYQFNYKRAKLNENSQVNSFLRYEMNENNNLKLGFNNLSFDKINNKKYVRFKHRGINKSIAVDYTILYNELKQATRWRISRQDTNIIGDYSLYSSLKLKRFENEWNPGVKFILKNNNNKFLFKKDYKKQYGLEYQRTFKYKSGKLKVGINNYGSTKFNISAKNEFFINSKEFYVSGNLTYDSSNKFELKNFKLGINIPFTVKLEKRDLNRVVGKIRGSQNKLGGLVLDINGQKVKTKSDGSFTAYIASSKRLLIKVAELGRYTGQYLLRPSLPYLIEDYSQETIFLDLIKFGNLKLNFKTNNYKRHSYLEAITDNEKQKSGTIILYNDQHTFFKKFKGEKEIDFKKIPPGQYILMVNNKQLRYNYDFNKMKIEIKSGNNKISIAKRTTNKEKLKIENETEKIEIDN